MNYKIEKLDCADDNDDNDDDLADRESPTVAYRLTWRMFLNPK